MIKDVYLTIPVVLERPGELIDNFRETKKGRNDLDSHIVSETLEDGDEHMTDLGKSMNKKEVVDCMNENIQTKTTMTYTRAVHGMGKKEIEEDLVANLESVIMEESDMIIETSGPRPSVEFSERVHERINHSMRRSLIVTLLGRKIGNVVKIDCNTSAGEREKFARLAMVVDLNKSLIASLSIDGVLRKLEYEGLLQICCKCGFATRKDNKNRTTMNNKEGKTTDNINGVEGSGIIAVVEEPNYPRSKTTQRNELIIVNPSGSMENVEVTFKNNGRAGRTTRSNVMRQNKGMKIRKSKETIKTSQVGLTEWVKTLEHKITTNGIPKEPGIPTDPPDVEKENFGRNKNVDLAAAGGSETDDVELSDCTLMTLRYHELADQRKGVKIAHKTPIRKALFDAHALHIELYSMIITILSGVTNIMFSKNVDRISRETIKEKLKYTERGTCEEIERLIRNFLWNKQEDGKGKSLVNWEKVCSPIDEGGLGFKIPKKRCSRFWKGVSLIWRVVRDSLELVSLLPQEILHRLLATMTPKQVEELDKPGWKWNPSRKFTVKSAYEVKTGTRPNTPDRLWRTIHRFKGLPRVKVFLWLMVNGRLMTNGERVRRHVHINP
ncbi:hypothetical protein F3Y22_tig00002237pilonHSYRG01828 [Hibiscus syriacus]|uniref:Uncharacterized protein n=1 Tax=Hibiscus syriacus TaxID=106335 RepID=A0A6A3CUZ3_HIBSY|nr:hypothetical protein F3Y22_tig00002237pilonHSYRG01828 [Hibiscus syriacus]